MGLLRWLTLGDSSRPTAVAPTSPFQAMRPATGTTGSVLEIRIPHIQPLNGYRKLTSDRENAMSTYDQQTLNSPNPIARFAHRKRLSTSIHLTKLITPVGRVLDYGCGAGAFVCEINRENGIDAVGYEPYMKEVKAVDLPIFREYNDVARSGQFHLITLGYLEILPLSRQP